MIKLYTTILIDYTNKSSVTFFPFHFINSFTIEIISSKTIIGYLFRSRQKRISDQMLAEADTRSGLSNVKGMVKTVPVGFGVFNLEQM